MFSRQEMMELQELGNGEHRGLASAFGNFIAEAAAVCLERKHKSGVELNVYGELEKKLLVTWDVVVTQQMLSTWNDEYEAVEYGATGIAILILKQLTGLYVLERSRRGLGFDYWMGEKDNLETLPLQREDVLHTKILEVSCPSGCVLVQEMTLIILLTLLGSRI